MKLHVSLALWIAACVAIFAWAYPTLVSWSVRVQDVIAAIPKH